MRIAVYTLTRDRLDFTRRCFATLWERAGCDFDHYVLDNGSTDGTPEWLREHERRFKAVVLSPENLGIARASNQVLDRIAEDGGYDLVTRIDNDCELVTPDLLAQLARLLEAEPGWRTRLALSPRVEGLVHQPARGRYLQLSGHLVGVTGAVGGIVHPIPWEVLRRYRYPEDLPLGSGDDVHLCRRLVEQGLLVGYVEDLVVRHHLTTIGQWNALRRKARRPGGGRLDVRVLTCGDADAVPVTVVVPVTASRRRFFEERGLPSVLANTPAAVVTVDGEAGASRKRNAGFERVRTPFVFFCDDDVVLEPACLARLLRALTETAAGRRAGYAYCGYRGLCAEGVAHPLGPTFVHEATPFDAAELQRRNLASTMSLVRSEWFVGFDESLDRLQDWDLWLALLDQGVEGVHVPETLFTAHYLDAGITQRVDGEAARAALRERHRLVPEGGPPEADMAISPRTAEVLDEVAKAWHLRTIVELGTGAGRSLDVLLRRARPDARVYTVDHDARCLAGAAAALPAAQRARTTLVHAGLVEGSWEGRRQPWYSPEALATVPGPIDLLFVDGPEGHVGRFPAVPAFLERLSPRATIVLDDCLRPGERGILEAWVQLLRARGHELVVDVFPTDRGLGRIQLLGSDEAVAAAVQRAAPRGLPSAATVPGRVLDRLVGFLAGRCPRGATVLDWGSGLGAARAGALARELDGRVLGLASGASAPAADAGADVVLAVRALERAGDDRSAAAAGDALGRALRPGGLVCALEPLGAAGDGPRRGEVDYCRLLPWATDLRCQLVLPVGDALFGVLVGRKAEPARPWVIDADDFHQGNSGLELLFELKGAVPAFKVTLFTVVGRCSERFLRGVRELDWVDLVPHGWLHDTPLECARWTYEEARDYLRRIEPLGLTRGFKAPGWQVSDGTYRALAEAGHWIADRRYNDHRRPSGLPAYLFEEADGRPYPERRHHHVQDVCGNGLRERLHELLALEGAFAFARDALTVVEPAAPLVGAGSR